jgi:hypothetical protein
MGRGPGMTVLARASRNLAVGSKVGQELHDSQSRETVKYNHESRKIRNQELLCWRRPAAIYPTDRPSEVIRPESGNCKVSRNALKPLRNSMQPIP